jgi:WD40 repeat protein
MPTRGALLVATAVCASASAQAPAPAPPPPAADIYLVALQATVGRLRIGDPVRITDWQGYDNQPHFAPDGGSVFYTSIREDGQADIYRFTIAGKTTARITSTSEGEFSPTVVPGGGALSVIRTEADGTQRLWRFPLDKAEPSLILKDVKPVGYHAWLEPQTRVLFVLGSPATLQLANARSGAAAVVASNIGRSLHRIPGTTRASFVDKSGAWTIRSFDPKTKASDAIVATLDGSEDYAWTPGGVLVMGQGSKLFSYQPGKDATWRFVADLANAGVRQITRLAVSPRGDRLALVGSP